ncbi:hypothetical protein BGZ46_001988 [Entomortierella lignicola]|nr:hypothetical protein BGZ46_001988 [Entomortierella lignicola]
MESLPVETFQLICSSCTLQALANLRLVSKTFRDRVDGSLTARRVHAIPNQAILQLGNHDQSACYVRVALNREHDPITVVFNRYNPQHNYLEFSQNSTSVIIEGAFSRPATEPTTQNTYYDFTMGKLSLNLWEQQRKEAAARKASPLPETPILQQDIAGSSSNSGRRVRRSSITQASLIRGTEHQIEQEIANNTPITPLSQIRPVRNALTSSFGTSSTSSTLTSSLPRDNVPQGDNYMKQFVRMMLGSTGTGPQNTQTRPGMTATELVEEARQLIHTVEPEVLSSQKQYKFNLTPGTHYLGDNGFIMRYSVSLNPSAQLLFKVDFIRVSWKWIISGVPAVLKQRVEEKQLYLADPMTLRDPFPQQRLGRIYAERYNLLLDEIEKQEIRHRVRGELALVGYDVTVIPRDYISVNLRSEPVLAWIMRVDSKEMKKKVRKDASYEDPTESKSTSIITPNETPDVEEESSDSDWEDILSQSKIDEGISTISLDASKEDSEDQEALQELLQGIKQNLGYLTARNILEEMLAKEGYSRDLIWKYGIIRRELMGSVPEVKHAKQLLQKILVSEAALK